MSQKVGWVGATRGTTCVAGVPRKKKAFGGEDIITGVCQRMLDVR